MFMDSDSASSSSATSSVAWNAMWFAPSVLTHPCPDYVQHAIEPGHGDYGSSSSSGGGSATGYDNFPVSHACAVRAAIMRDTAQCLEFCVRWLELNVNNTASIPDAPVTLQNATRVWRQFYTEWQTPCGNHLNVPDLVFVAMCHLRLCCEPDPLKRIGSPLSYADACAFRTYTQNAMRRWNIEPSIIHTEVDAKVFYAAQLIVHWGSHVSTQTLTNTVLSAEDISLLTLNVNVHDSDDNRVRFGAQKTAAPASASTDIGIVNKEREPDDLVLADVVQLTSRYAFFAMMHAAAACVSSRPTTAIHTRIAEMAPLSPAHKLVTYNVKQLRVTLLQRRQFAVPESLRRGIAFSIWKRQMSVGSIEAYLRMAPSISWDRVNPVAICVHDPTAALEPIRTIKCAANDDTPSPEWPGHVRVCFDEVWDVAMWHHLLTDVSVDFHEQHVIYAHDLRHKSHLIGQSQVNLRARLPILVHVSGSWCVHAFTSIWRADSHLEAIYIWCWIVVRFYNYRNEEGVSLRPIFQRIQLTFE